MENNIKDLIQVSKYAITGNQKDAFAYVKRMARRYSKTHPDVADLLNDIIDGVQNENSLLRWASGTESPVDLDSRQQLLQVDAAPFLESDLVLPPDVQGSLDQIVREHSNAHVLYQAGLFPTRTALFTGGPGLGKSMSAKWLANALHIPLATLSLPSVMSSFLGRTGGNLHAVLDYAKSTKCILFLDELDAIAKRRDDTSEIGELKRLVTVLLQEIDQWPAGSLLIGATNHPDLLDPAIWRRFEHVIEFHTPSQMLLAECISNQLGDVTGSANWANVLSILLNGRSFSDAVRVVVTLQRKAIVHGMSITDVLTEFATQQAQNLDRSSKKSLALSLAEMGFSHRWIQSNTGVSKDTIRKWSNQDKQDEQDTTTEESSEE